MTKKFNKNQKIDLIMLNMSSFYDWEQGIVNRNYHILHNLAKDPRINRIIAIDFLPIGFKKCVKHYLQNILWQSKDGEMIYGDLTSVCYQKTNKIYTYSTVDSFFGMKQVIKELRRVERILNLKNIVFWSYNPMFVELIDKLKEQMFIFDAVDNWAEHNSYLKLMKKQKILKNYQTIADKADLIFTVSETMVDFFQNLKRTKDLHWIPNGVAYDHYNDPVLTKKDNELEGIDKPIIGYLGTIEQRIDLDLLKYLLKENQDKHFALCGPVWKTIKPELEKKLGDFENLTLTGRINYYDAPTYFTDFNVGILPNKTADGLVKSNNPMKIYEYLAVGKPAVVTDIPGTKPFKDLIYISKNKEEFNQKIQQALQEDSTEKQKARQTEAKKHAWSDRVGKMLELIFM